MNQQLYWKGPFVGRCNKSTDVAVWDLMTVGEL